MITWQIKTHQVRGGKPTIWLNVPNSTSEKNTFGINTNLEVFDQYGRYLYKLHPIEFLNRVQNYHLWIPHYLKTGRILFLKAGSKYYFVKDGQIEKRGK